MAKKLPGVPIVVDENRYRGGIYIIEKFKPDLIILDDAFQHRSLARDIDVVLINSQDQQVDHRMFPYGSLREPPKNLKRADFVILSKTNIKTPSSYLIGLTKKVGTHLEEMDPKHLKLHYILLLHHYILCLILVRLYMTLLYFYH